MAQYLIVTHKTAFAPELRDKVRELAGEDPHAEFGNIGTRGARRELHLGGRDGKSSAGDG